MLLTVIALVVVSCGASGSDPSPSPPSGRSGTEPIPVVCPTGAPDCLAWDTFDGSVGPITRSTSGQLWATWGLGCPDCHPIFETDGSRATMAPGADNVFIWLATIDTGRASGLTVSADITVSPTPERANVGLVGLFADRANHLVCKIEVSEGHPDGLLAIGDERADVTTSLLAGRDHVDFTSGGTYRLELHVPTSLEDFPVTCTASGGGIKRSKVAYRLPPEAIAAYGSGTGQGLRIKIFDDEDDGGSTWRDFRVTPGGASSR